MPGSVTVSRHLHGATVDHMDAERLAGMLGALGMMLDGRGPERLSDAQLTALGAPRIESREEISTWARRMCADLEEQMHQGLGHA